MTPPFCQTSLRKVLTLHFGDFFFLRPNDDNSRKPKTGREALKCADADLEKVTSDLKHGQDAILPFLPSACKALVI